MPRGCVFERLSGLSLDFRPDRKRPRERGACEHAGAHELSLEQPLAQPRPVALDGEAHVHLDAALVAPAANRRRQCSVEGVARYRPVPAARGEHVERIAQTQFHLWLQDERRQPLAVSRPAARLVAIERCEHLMRMPALAARGTALLMHQRMQTLRLAHRLPRGPATLAAERFARGDREHLPQRALVDARRIERHEEQLDAKPSPLQKPRRPPCGELLVEELIACVADEQRLRAAFGGEWRIDAAALEMERLIRRLGTRADAVERGKVEPQRTLALETLDCGVCGGEARESPRIQINARRREVIAADRGEARFQMKATWLNTPKSAKWASTGAHGPAGCSRAPVPAAASSAHGTARF